MHALSVYLASVLVEEEERKREREMKEETYCVFVNSVLRGSHRLCQVKLTLQTAKLFYILFCQSFFPSARPSLGLAFCPLISV